MDTCVRESVVCFSINWNLINCWKRFVWGVEVFQVNSLTIKYIFWGYNIVLFHVIYKRRARIIDEKYVKNKNFILKHAISLQPMYEKRYHIKSSKYTAALSYKPHVHTMWWWWERTGDEKRFRNSARNVLLLYQMHIKLTHNNMLILNERKYLILHIDSGFN